MIVAAVLAVSVVLIGRRADELCGSARQEFLRAERRRVS